MSVAVTPTRIPPKSSPSPSIEPIADTEPTNPSVKWVIILAFVLIFAVIVGSIFLQKQPERPSKDDPVR